MKQNRLYGLVVSVCIILGVVAAGPVFFIPAVQASPYTTAGSQEQTTDQVRELGESFEQNDAPFLEGEATLSQPQDETILEEGLEEGLEEEPLENIEGLEELPEENQESPLPAP